MTSDDDKGLLKLAHTRRPRRGTHGVLNVFRAEMFLEWVLLAACVASAIMILIKRPAFGIDTLWTIADAMLVLALLSALLELWVRYRHGRLKKMAPRLVTFASVLAGFLLFQLITGRLAAGS